MSHFTKNIEWKLNSNNYLTLGWDEETEDGASLKNVLTGVYPEDAVITVTVKDRYGTDVVDAVDVPMPIVAGTSGEDTQYRAEFPSTLDLEVGSYHGVATVTVGATQVELSKQILVVRG